MGSAPDDGGHRGELGSRKYRDASRLDAFLVFGISFHLAADSPAWRLALDAIGGSGRVKGASNVVVWASVFEANRRVATTANLLIIAGTVERQGRVAYVVARSIKPLGDEGPSPPTRSRDFH